MGLTIDGGYPTGTWFNTLIYGTATNTTGDPSMNLGYQRAGCSYWTQEKYEAHDITTVFIAADSGQQKIVNNSNGTGYAASPTNAINGGMQSVASGTFRLLSAYKTTITTAAIDGDFCQAAPWTPP